MDLICLDFEASGLGAQSYPIEVAWCDAVTGDQDTFLISPDTVQGWTDWDTAAEGIHGITRQQLLTEGVGAGAACWRLNRALEGKTVYCDAIEFDHFWLRRLFDAAQMRPLFKLRGVEMLMNSAQTRHFIAAIERHRRNHRALDDVLDLIRALGIALREP